MDKDWEKITGNKAAIAPRSIKRIEKDIKDIIINPPCGIFALPDDENMRLMNVLITGPKDTPYHGGMFSFRIGFTDDYPIKPPKVKCLTTGGNTVRFNPNIYSCGKVCLSILGTFSGPGWSPVMNLTSVVVSIQSLLNEEPYRNEPGYEDGEVENVKDYNDIIQHETIRIAVIDVMEKKDTYHEDFVEKIETIFNQNYDHYIKVCQENLHLEGNPMKDPYDKMWQDVRGNFQYKTLLEKLERLKNERSDA